MQLFVIGWGQHIQRWGSPFFVVEVFDVTGHGGAQFRDGVPLLSAKEVGLHAAPEGSITALS